MSDIRSAARTLLKTPAFTLVVVLTLALGIGANTAIFSLTDQLLLRLLPVQNPQQLVMFEESWAVPGPDQQQHVLVSDVSRLSRSQHRVSDCPPPTIR
jgi:hypothetical protein